MGTASRLSTLKEPMPPLLAANWFFVALFSGKLSPVTRNLEHQTPLQQTTEPAAARAPTVAAEATPAATAAGLEAQEVGGRDGPEPTRFGDWELRGRCIDF
jgi:hypothetical protein